jgi:hypothetical protein
MTTTSGLSYEERRAIEVAEKQAALAALETLRTDLARILNFKYVTFPAAEEREGYLVTPEGARVYVSYEGYNQYERVSVSGYLNIGKNNQYVEAYDPANNNQRVSLESISVAVKRGAEVIAKEITRRFLPQYLRIFALAQARVRRDVEYQSNVRRNLVTLLPLIGKTEKDLREDYSEISYYTEGRGYGTIRSHEDSVTLTLNSVSVEKAKQILAILEIK